LQTYVHHIFGISSFYFALLLENSATLTGAVANQFTEISTPFLHFRQLMYIHDMRDSQWFKINTVIFFLTFTFGRVFFQLLFIWCAKDWIYDQFSNLDKFYTPNEQWMLMIGVSA